MALQKTWSNSFLSKLSSILCFTIIFRKHDIELYVIQFQMLVKKESPDLYILLANYKMSNFETKKKSHVFNISRRLLHDLDLPHEHSSVKQQSSFKVFHFYILDQVSGLQRC